MNCIDFYSGIGGWTLGMKLAGVTHHSSFEWSPSSNATHNINFGTSNKESDIRKLDLKSLPKPNSIDFIVGSPPCTQFSYSNRGGNGDINDGLIDLHKFLTIVEYLKPKCWAMENVPRVKGILNELTKSHPDFQRFRKLITFNEIVNCLDYGVPQGRKRMVCGNFPSELFISYKDKIPRMSMRDALSQLEKPPYQDLLFGKTIDAITENEKEVPLTDEEIRINREAKAYHPVYNKMSFPDELDRAARTVTSLCTRVSRESIIIADSGHFRRLTIREKATLMGFPLNFEFYAKSHSTKLKMIGNAIPPPLTFHIFNAMLENEYTPLKTGACYSHIAPVEDLISTPPPAPRRLYSPNRRFRFCIPSLRFGSGVRFELSNTEGEWRIRFFYGSSKQILAINLDKKVENELSEHIEPLMSDFDLTLPTKLSSKTLQIGWTGGENHPFKILDHLGSLGCNIEKKLSQLNHSESILDSIMPLKLNKSLKNNAIKTIAGLYLGSKFNTEMEKRDKL